MSFTWIDATELLICWFVFSLLAGGVVCAFLYGANKLNNRLNARERQLDDEEQMKAIKNR